MARAFLSIVALAAGLALAGPASAASEADLDATAKALIAVDHDRFADARRYAAAIADPLARKIVDWRLYGDDESGAGFDAIAGFLRANPDWPSSSRLRASAEAAMPPTLPPHEVLAWFDEHPPETAKGVMRRIEALAAAGRGDEATALARSAWASDAIGPGDERAFAAAFGDRLRAEDHYARIDAYLWKLHTNTAARLLDTYRIPAGLRAAVEARIVLLRGRGPGETAGAKLLAGLPEALRGDPGVLYAELRWHRENDRNDAAGAVLSTAPADPEHAGMWWRERHILARRAVFDEADPQRAHALLRDHRMQDGTGADFLEAEWTAGWVALRHLADPDAAFIHFNRVFIGATTPISLSRGAYWLGRAAEAMDNAGWARQWYTEAARHGTTHYGQLAAARLAEPAIVLPPAPSVDPARRAAFAERELARAARIAVQVGEEHLAYLFLTALRGTARDTAERQFAAEIAVAMGFPNVAVRAGKDAARDGVVLVDAAYPRIAVPSLAIDESLVRGLMRQESEFNVRAVSSAGARGLMQLMPGTAKRMAGILKIGYSTAKLTADPVYNIRLGEAYLQRMLERYDGLLPLALAAYNAGPHRVDAWIEQYGDPRGAHVDLIDWIETIPYGETRNYVQRVLESMQVYRTMAGDPTLAATDPRTHWRVVPTATAEAEACAASADAC